MKNKVLKGFDEDSLERLFKDVEILLSVFPDDPSVVNASVDLIVTVLRAVETAIGFFLEHRGKSSISRSGPAQPTPGRVPATSMLITVTSFYSCTGRVGSRPGC